MTPSGLSNREYERALQVADAAPQMAGKAH
jgi:hypothetical protein